MTATAGFSAFALESFPELHLGDDLAETVIAALASTGTELRDGDVLVVASKVVSIAEQRHVDLTTITPSDEAVKLSARTGKPAEIVQLILDNSVDHFLAGDRGPIIATHTLGYQLTSAGIDRAGPHGAWLLPADPDASARFLRDAVHAATGTTVAVVIADSDGRADRRGATVISIGAAGISPLRVTTHDGKHQEETITDMIAAAAGIVIGQRGRGTPVAILRGIDFSTGDDGVASMLHCAP